MDTVLKSTDLPVVHRYEPPPGLGQARQWSAPGVSLTVKAVCAPCNNGWMSKLESEAMPLLRPLILGQNRVLTAAECAVVSRWCLKTMLMVELAAPAEQRAPSDELGHWFRSRTLPEDRVTVWMAGARRSSGVALAWRGIDVRQGDVEIGTGWLRVLVLGHLILLAYSGPRGYHQAGVRPPMAASLTRLWPTRALIAALPAKTRWLKRDQVPLILHMTAQCLT